MNKIFGLGTLLTLLAVAPAMNASMATYTLDQDGCTGGCGTAPFGTITLTDNGSGTSAFVSVVLTLAANENFAGTGAGDALEFNVTGAVNITNITTNFGVGPSPDSASTFGSFLHSVTCTSCQGGKGPAGPLSFDVGSATGVTVASFIANSGGFFFASDILGNNGKTGNVAALAGTTSNVPEPATLSMLGAGLLGLGFIRSRVRK